MPSGSTHLKIEAGLMIAWAAASAALVVCERVPLRHALLFLAGYVFSMLFLSPDLDLADSRAVRRWGALRWIWYPYALLFRHRQLSHHLLWGPLSRVAYLGALGLGIGVAVLAVIGSRTPRIQVSADIVLPVCLGLYLPNVEHILADRICTQWRRRVRRRL